MNRVSRNSRVEAARSSLVNDAAPAHDAELREIAGYRVTRRLAVGKRAAVYLGHPQRKASERLERGLGRAAVPPQRSGVSSRIFAEDGDMAVRPEDGAVALRVFHSNADASLVDTEIAVLTSVPKGVAPELHDVVSMPDGRLCLVMERDDGPTLAELVRSRGTIRAGEAVTLLAPLTLALSLLHKQGWAHGALSSSAVRLDAHGRSRISKWGSAVRLGNPIERTRLLRGDYEALVSIITQTCGAIDSQSVARRDLEALVEWMTERLVARPFLPFDEHLERRLFALAKPLAVRMVNDEEAECNRIDTHAAVPARFTVLAGGRGIAQDGASADDPDRAPGGFWRRLSASEPLGVVLAGAADGLSANGSLSALKARMTTAIQARRGALIVAGCVSAALFVLAITVIPPSEQASQAVDAVEKSQTEGDVSQPKSASTGAPVEREAVLADSETDGNDAPVASEGEAHAEADAAQSDDPVVAAGALLALRAECFRESSILCLADAVASGSPLAEADAASIRQAQQSGTVVLPTAFSAESLALVERNGAAVLLSMTSDGVQTKPASLLMMRSEAGWRLREIFDY